MQHLDPDRLVLLALSEQTEPGEGDHLAECPVCRHDLETMRDVAALAADGQDLTDLPQPPERIWQAIEADIHAAAPAATPAPVSDLAERRERAKRRRSRWLIPLVAAAAAAVAAVVGTVAVDRWADRSNEQVTARATLTPLTSVPAAAGGSVRVLADGQMQIDVRNLPLTTGYHEVWLIDPDDPAKMVAVGNLSDKAVVALPVPPGTDLNRYRLVDVSDEPHDGDAAHSGRSLLRGTLTS